MSILGFTIQDMRMALNFFRINLKDRYLGSVLGVYWAFINPLLMLGIYTFVFGFIFKAKAPGSEKSLSYVVWLISGLAPWFGISEGLSSGCNSIVMNSNIIKNITFKSEILPISASLIGLVPFAIASAFLFVLIPFSGGYYSWHILWLAAVVLLQVTFISGISFFTAAITVFIRDAAQLISSLLLLGLFFTPVFYAKEMMPRIVQKITFFNPLFQIVDGYRSCLVFHRAPDPKGLVYLLVLNIALWLSGLIFFRRLKGYFTSCL